MELYKDILVHFLTEHYAKAPIPGFSESIKEIVEMKCYTALRQIRAIVQDESLDDSECFAKIEGIVQVLEALGSNGGFRHDFG